MANSTEIDAGPNSERSDKNMFQSRWGIINRYVYVVVLLCSIVLGFIESTLINKSGNSGAANHIIELFWYVFPAYLITDGILSKSFLWCPLRAAFPPLVREFVSWLALDRQYSSFQNSTLPFAEAFAYFLGSLVVVAIFTRALGISFKVSERAIGFFGWFLVGSLVIWISNFFFYWDYSLPVVTVIAISILLLLRRYRLVYGIVAGVITNILIYLLLFGLLFGGGLNWKTISLSLLYGISSPFFQSGGFF